MFVVFSFVLQQKRNPDVQKGLSTKLPVQTNTLSRRMERNTKKEV